MCACVCVGGGGGLMIVKAQFLSCQSHGFDQTRIKRPPACRQEVDKSAAGSVHGCHLTRCKQSGQNIRMKSNSDIDCHLQDVRNRNKSFQLNYIKSNSNIDVHLSTCNQSEQIVPP